MRKISRRHQENQTKTNNIVFSNLDEAIKIVEGTARNMGISVSD